MTTTLLPSPPARLIAPPRRPSRGPFRPDIEGMRAVALLLVLAFHALIPGTGGGFVGVDIFFVISGYLITGQLYAESRTDDRISVAGFFARRARRILPPAAVVLGATAVAMHLLLPPLTVERFSRDIAASFAYVANWRFIAQGKDYLASSQSDSIVLHYWSLAVEEQFYLVWPFLIIAAAGLARFLRVRRRSTIAVALALTTGASLAASILLTRSDPGLAYMATYTRAWQFGVGGLVALAMAGRTRAELPAQERLTAAPTQADVPLALATALGVLGLGALAASVVLIDPSTPYPGTAALLPTLGTAALLAAGPRGLVSRAIANPVFRAIGRWSFSWYLWHWPVLILAEARIDDLTWQVRTLLTLGSGVLAWLTYKLVEEPTKRISRAPRELRLSVVAGVTTTALAVGALGYVAWTAQDELDAPAVKVALGSVLDPVPFQRIFNSQANSGGVTPAPADAADDNAGRCLIAGEMKQPDCHSGVPGGTPVVLFGDSHANQWLSALTPIAEANKWDLQQITRSGCPVPNLKPVAGLSDPFSQSYCTTWREEQIASIVALKPKYLIFSSYSHYLYDRAEFSENWKESIEQLRASGSRLVYLADTPYAEFDVPECISASFDDWSECSFKPKDPEDPVVAMVRSGELRDITVVDLDAIICPEKKCPAVRGGVLLYRDNAHLTATAVRLLAYPLNEQLTQEGIR